MTDRRDSKKDHADKQHDPFLYYDRGGEGAAAPFSTLFVLMFYHTQRCMKEARMDPLRSLPASDIRIPRDPPEGRGYVKTPPSPSLFIFPPPRPITLNL